MSDFSENSFTYSFPKDYFDNPHSDVLLHFGESQYFPELTLPVQFDLVPLSKGDYHFIQSEDKASWAEPSFEDLVLKLKDAKEFAVDSSRVDRLKQYAHEQFSAQATGKKMKVRLSQIKTYLTSQANEKLLKKDQSK
jgi:hypothetical protein